MVTTISVISNSLLIHKPHRIRCSKHEVLKHLGQIRYSPQKTKIFIAYELRNASKRRRKFISTEATSWLLFNSKKFLTTFQFLKGTALFRTKLTRPMM